MLCTAKINIDKIHLNLSGKTEEGILFSLDTSENLVVFNPSIESKFLRDHLEESIKKVAKDILDDLKSLSEKRNYEAYYKHHP